MRKQILDHGYIELVETWGSDEQIVESARMSTQKGFNGWGDEAKPGDEKLLRFLWENKHSTPFEFAGLTIEVRAPIMVFREWHRHRTQSYSEASARYSPLPSDDYMPQVSRLLANGGANRQAGAAKDSAELTADTAREWRSELEAVYEHAERVYQRGLALGVPKELARLSMTVGRFSTMRASTDLRNWLAFCALRMPANAQWEIRQYADAVGSILAERFPRTWALFSEKI